MIAHAVGHNALFLTGRSHYLTAGAHTEGVHAPVADMLGKLVFAPGQRRMPGSFMVQAFSISVCRCSARKPTLKGLHSSTRPLSISMLNVSRAECPTANTSVSQAKLPFVVVMPTSRPFFVPAR